jgi:hypothetical protein
MSFAGPKGSAHIFELKAHHETQPNRTQPRFSRG